MRHLFDRHGRAVDRLSQPRCSFERALPPLERVVVFIDDLRLYPANRILAGTPALPDFAVNV
jgi:hypothetical protein